MLGEITTSVSDEMMNRTDKEDRASSDVTTLRYVTDMDENATDSIINNTGKDLFKAFEKGCKEKFI